MLYDRLDGLREQAAHRLTAELRDTGGTLQDRSQRDSSVAMYADQVEQFSAVENGLCFGRLDGDDDSRRYIGRIGIFDTSGDYDPLLMDWRAPAARPFYLATAANPQGVRRRRHLRTRQRKVTGLDDEVLDLDTAAPGAPRGADRRGVAARRAQRGPDRPDARHRRDHPGRAGPRSSAPSCRACWWSRAAPAPARPPSRCTGPRTCSTPTAGELSSRGVLMVGPNATFLRYISQVLPSLAETGVLLRTLGDLFPGVSARRTEPAEAAALKGRAVMAEVLAAGRRDRQWVPDEPLEIEVERETLTARPGDRARRPGTGPAASDRPHNLARALFDVEIVHALADQVAERIGADPLRRGRTCSTRRTAPRSAGSCARSRRSRPRWTGCGRCSPRSGCSPTCSPTRTRIAAAAPMLTEDERALLRREPAAAGRRPTCRCWTRRPSCSARTSAPPPPGGTASAPMRTGVRRGRAGDRPGLPLDRRRGRGRGR